MCEIFTQSVTLWKGVRNMLIAFSVGNYRSFKEQVTLSLVAAGLNSKPRELDTNNVFTIGNELKLLTSAAIYGANASGKSNLVAALSFMRSFILNSSRETRLRQPVGIQPFRLSSETDKHPSHFEIVFVQGDVLYRYGFVVSRNRIEQEWLYHTPGKKEGYLFERTHDMIQINKRSFPEGVGLEERTRPNALFLSVAAQWNGKKAASLTDWFERLTINSGLDDNDVRNGLAARFALTDYQRGIIQFIKQLDLGIDDIQLEQQPKRVVTIGASDGSQRQVTLGGFSEIITLHKKYNAAGESIALEPFQLLTNESQGTRRLFSLAEPILTALRSGTVLVIDEIDARLHPIITCEIIKLFNSPETNSRHAQLILTTHDTNLLRNNLFRRDQIWFIEKSGRGESMLYSLAEYRVRNDASYEKNYIQGRYGAIPFIGDLATVVGEPYDQAQNGEEAIEEQASLFQEDDDGFLLATPDRDEG
jgi:AAA15 family ATPase/GTPase